MLKNTMLKGKRSGNKLNPRIHLGSVYTGPTEYLVGQIFCHLGVAFTRGAANRPQIRSLRRANIRPLRKETFCGTWPDAGQVRERPRVNGFGRYHKEGVNMRLRGL